MYKIRLRKRTKSKLTKLKPYTNTLKAIFNILEVKEVTYGKLLCPKTQLYEVKRHRLPLRVYYTLKRSAHSSRHLYIQTHQHILPLAFRAWAKIAHLFANSYLMVYFGIYRVYDKIVKNHTQKQEMS